MENDQGNFYPGNKVADFLIGLVVNLLACIVAFAVGGAFASYTFLIIFIISFVLLQIALGVLFIRIRRVYLLIGMVSAVAIPLLVIGGCFLIFFR